MTPHVQIYMFLSPLTGLEISSYRNSHAVTEQYRFPFWSNEDSKETETTALPLIHAG